MEFSKAFIPAHVRYDFVSPIGKTFTLKQWTSCWLNVKISGKNDYKVQLTCYPKQRDECQLFFVELDYRQIEHGKLESRSMSFSAALAWRNGARENRIYYAIDESFLFRKFNRYLFNLSLIMELYDGIDNAHERSFITKDTIAFDEGNVFDTDDERPPSQDRKTSTAEPPVYAQVIPKHKRPHYGAPKLIVHPNEERIEIVCSAVDSPERSKADDSLEAPMEIMGVDDGVDYSEVQLRPKSENTNRILARPLAVVSGLFKARFSADASKVPAADIRKSRPVSRKETNRASWNIFRSKPKPEPRIPSFLHFAEPSNTERSLSVSTGKSLNRYSDWFDLNTTQMKDVEHCISQSIERNKRRDQARRHSESVAVHKQSATRNHLTISGEIPRTHNLALGRNAMVDASQINLMGANINRERKYRKYTSSEGSDEGLSSISSDRSDTFGHDAAMKPILDNLAHQTKLVNKITKTINGLSKMTSPTRRSSGFVSGSTTDSDASSSSEQKRHPSSIETKVVVVGNRAYATREHAFKVPATTKVLKAARPSSKSARSSRSPKMPRPSLVSPVLARIAPAPVTPRAKPRAAPRAAPRATPRETPREIPRATPRAAIVSMPLPACTKALLGTNIPRTVLSANPPTTPATLIGSQRIKPTRHLAGAASRTPIRRKKVDNFFSYQTFADCYNINHQYKYQVTQKSRPCTDTGTLNGSGSSVAPPTPPRQESLTKVATIDVDAATKSPAKSPSMLKRIRRMLHITTRRSIFI